MFSSLLFMLVLQAKAESINLEDSSIQITLPDKSFKRLMNKVAEDPIELTEVASTALFKTKLPIIISYSPGPSGDPHFIFSYENKDRTVVGSINGKKLTIQSNGDIYSSGHTNNMFSGVRKYSIKNEKLVENQQPFLFVGIKSKALKNSEARATTKKDSEVVFQILKGEPYEIVLSDNEEQYFLVKDKIGVMGWVHIANEQTPTLFKELYYYGD